MPKIFLEENFPYTPDQLFSIVADVESYPLFLPWCEGAKIVEVNGDIIIADLLIGYKGISKNYRSKVILDKPSNQIKVELISGPFKHLYQEWQFVALESNVTKVIFDIDFALHSQLLESLIKAIIPTICQKFIKAFSERTTEVFG